MKKTDNQKYNSKMVRNTRNLISVIFLSLVSLLSLSVCIGLLLNNAAIRRQADASRSELDALEAEGYYTKAQTTQMIEKTASDVQTETVREISERIRKYAAEGNELEAFRQLFPDEIVVEYAGKYAFYTIYEDIPRNLISDEELSRTSDGFLEYTGCNDSFTVKRAIDVTRAQGEIDFEKVKNAGIDLVMIRTGLRGSAEGIILEDDNFKTNIVNATKAGLEVGVFFNSQAATVEEAEEEAYFVLDLIEPYEVAGPVSIVLEQFNLTDSRTAQLTGAIYSDIADAYCSKIKDAGYEPMIAGSIRTLVGLLDKELLTKYPIWVNYVNDTQYYPYEYTMWQYSKSGRVDGISVDVGIDIFIDKNNAEEVK